MLRAKNIDWEKSKEFLLNTERSRHVLTVTMDHSMLIRFSKKKEWSSLRCFDQSALLKFMTHPVRGLNQSQGSFDSRDSPFSKFIGLSHFP